MIDTVFNLISISKYQLFVHLIFQQTKYGGEQCRRRLFPQPSGRTSFIDRVGQFQPGPDDQFDV